MKGKDYRELQLSSSQLVFIFVGILILGIVVFLLGVSVGKKQAQLTRDPGIASKTDIEKVKETPPLPVQKPENSIKKELASHRKVKDEAPKQPPAITGKSLYYIQMGAFYKKEAALAFAKKFKAKGYRTLVLDPLPPDKKQIFRVRIGGFKSKEKAIEVKTRLKSGMKKKSDYFVIKS